MTKEKQIEEMALTEIDILANDLNDHCPDLAENYCGTTCLSCLAHALTDKGYRKASDVAREIFAEIDALTIGSIIPNDCAIISLVRLAELKKKYTEGGNG